LSNEGGIEQSTHENFTLIDPHLFCVDGTISQDMSQRLSQGAALTTVNMRQSAKAQSARRSRIAAAAATFCTEGGTGLQHILPDVVAADCYKRNELANKIGMAGDYIAAGSGFLSAFPPAAVAGFAAGLAVKAGGEIGKHIERRAIRNIYDLLADAVVQNVSPRDVQNLRYVLASRGISSDANHRLEVWAFCRALEKEQSSIPEATREPVVRWLEEKLLANLDARTNDVGFQGQIDRELGPSLVAGQVTVSWAQTPRDSIQRIQAPANDSNAFAALLPARIKAELTRGLQVCALWARSCLSRQKSPKPPTVP